jgi:hypothetical protein
MKRMSLFVCVIAAALAAGNVASAQLIPPGGSQFNPPPPPPPPSPKIEVPAIPQMGVPSGPSVQSAPRPSFSDRITTCLDQGAAGGLGPNDRATYSRSCANQD